MMDYRKMRDPEIVEKQYRDTINLEKHKTFHEKYSTNKEGFIEWMFKKYVFFNGCNILELGSGKGNLWDDKTNLIGEGSSLTLSDLSDGMVSYMKSKYFDKSEIKIMKIDAQRIPFSDETFDIVIANSMLYHMPDLQKSVSEIWRVLKKMEYFMHQHLAKMGFQNI